MTSKEAPAPQSEQARLWKEAASQAALLEHASSSVPRSEATRMLVTVQAGKKLGAGVGWYLPSQRRHDWAWLAARHQVNADGRITRKDFKGPPEFFDRLDRDGNGAITADDLDWSERSEWARQDAQALRLLRAIDSDGNGRVNEKEWLAYFKKLAGEKGYITNEDLRQPSAIGGEKGKERKVSQEVWLRHLIAGDLGSPFEGPRVDQVAPDFTLPANDGKTTITLSEFRGRKPVVLIFGSFT